MNLKYNPKLQSALIETGKAVAAKSTELTPSVSNLEKLFDNLLIAIDKEDMKGQSRASKELITALVKWQIETL